jgi:hypothetical protein
MSDVANVHPSQRLVLPWDSDGEAVDIDVEVVPLVQQLWALGLQTAGCCQDLGESIITTESPTASAGRRRHAAFYQGQAWLKMPVDDAQHMLGILAKSPGFREQLRRWTHPDAWETYAYLLPTDDGVRMSSWAQVHFPNDQIGEVVELLGASGSDA